MLKSELSYLESYSKIISSYLKKHEDISSFYDDIDSLNIGSLQNIYSKKDFDYLTSFDSILSIVISIIRSPLITSTTNEIIIRSGQASSLTNDDFVKSLSDSSLWKSKNGKMVPEYVYFHEYVDELKTYENYFIVQLINAINKEIELYSYSYSSKINSFKNIDSKLTKSNTFEEDIASLIDKIEKKIHLIKDTNFYKMINKDHHYIQNVVATNILLSNVLYNRCFRFYKEMISNIDSNELNKSLSIYYYCLILKFFHNYENRLQLKKSSNYKITPDKTDFILEFYNNDLDASIRLKDNIFYINRKIKTTKISNSIEILICHNIDGLDLNKYILDNVDSFNFVSIWHFGYVENNKIYIANNDPISEVNMIDEIFKSHYEVISGSRKIYSHYCPICKSKDIYIDDNETYICSNCSSTYRFISANKGEEKIIITKARRKHE